MTTIAIAGMGPLLGLGLARKFGTEGFNVAMIARGQAALADAEAKLKSEGIEAAGFAADLANPEDVDRAFAAIGERYGR